MTLLSITNQVAKRVGVDDFDSVINNALAAKMLQFAIEASEEISRRADWPEMRLDAVAISVDANTAVDLPDQFHRLQASVTPRKTSTGEPARNGRNRAMWDIIARNTSGIPYFLIEGQTIRLSHTAENHTIPYVTTYYAKADTTEVGKATYSADNDNPRFPEILLRMGMVWRYLRDMDMPYDDELAEFEGQLAIEVLAAGGGGL